MYKIIILMIIIIYFEFLHQINSRKLREYSILLYKPSMSPQNGTMLKVLCNTHMLREARYVKRHNNEGK